MPIVPGTVGVDLEARIVRGSAAGVAGNKSCSMEADWPALRFVYRLADDR
jgi:hypothetical protein